MVRTVTLSGLRSHGKTHRPHSHSTSFGHMTTILNTFILVCSEFLENQISSRQLTISCDLVHAMHREDSEYRTEADTTDSKHI